MKKKWGNRKKSSFPYHSRLLIGELSGLCVVIAVESIPSVLKTPGTDAVVIIPEDADVRAGPEDLRISVPAIRDGRVLAKVGGSVGPLIQKCLIGLKRQTINNRY